MLFQRAPQAASRGCLRNQLAAMAAPALCAGTGKHSQFALLGPLDDLHTSGPTIFDNGIIDLRTSIFTRCYEGTIEKTDLIGTHFIRLTGEGPL